MKPGIHPDYHPVVFQDATTGARFLTRSTITCSKPSSGRLRRACKPTRWWWLRCRRTRIRFGRARGALSTPPDGWKSSTGDTASESVANNALVAHQEIGQKPVVRDLG